MNDSELDKRPKINMPEIKGAVVSEPKGSETELDITATKIITTEVSKEVTIPAVYIPEAPFSKADTIPSNWSIKPVQCVEGMIEAYNNITFTKFVGNITDFNAKLRGE
jgi:hypothetical protein